MGFITIAAWDFAFGPVNETMLYAVVALYLAYAEAGLAYGVDAHHREVGGRGPSAGPPLPARIPLGGLPAGTRSWQHPNLSGTQRVRWFSSQFDLRGDACSWPQVSSGTVPERARRHLRS